MGLLHTRWYWKIIANFCKRNAGCICYIFSLRFWCSVQFQIVPSYNHCLYFDLHFLTKYANHLCSLNFITLVRWHLKQTDSNPTFRLFKQPRWITPLESPTARHYFNISRLLTKCQVQCRMSISESITTFYLFITKQPNSITATKSYTNTATKSYTKPIQNQSKTNTTVLITSCLNLDSLLS